MHKQKVLFRDLGVMDYKRAWDYQEELLASNVAIKSARWREEKDDGSQKTKEELATVHHLLFVEHPPVYTLGKSGSIENVLISEQERESNNLGFYRINRGGDITFHGPGQIVGYPILDLEKFYTDIGIYMRNIEEVVIRTCSAYGIVAGRSPGETGVWIDPDKRGRERKICAIGIRCSRWITMHGFAFNVNTDLDYFNNIIPCGIQGKQVTSLQKELGRETNIDEVKAFVKNNFMEVFNAELAEVRNLSV
jgi:lipoyl(octanoyl) transferase